MALHTTRQFVASRAALEQEMKRRRRVELALHDAQKLEALGRLTGGVAHDFNNLLMIVSNCLFLLKRKMPDQPAELAPIERAVSAGAKLTRQLLSFSRRQMSHPERMVLQDVLPEITDLLRPAIGSAVHLAIDVHPATRPVVIERAEFELALVNLAINARDAMPKGGELRIVAEPYVAPDKEDGDFVVLRVRDTGTGIPAELLPRVFEPFFTTKALGEGTGLGLSQVYGFCKQAGGRAEVASEVGKGTEVRLILPAASTVAEPAHVATSAEVNVAGLRILLVEDNEGVAGSTASILRSLGCQVVWQASADDAVGHLERNAGEFDAVLSDIVMPGTRDGLALALLVRERHAKLPIVLMSGYSASVPDAKAHGFTVLTKPCTARAMAEALAEACALDEGKGQLGSAA